MFSVPVTSQLVADGTFEPRPFVSGTCLNQDSRTGETLSVCLEERRDEGPGGRLVCVPPVDRPSSQVDRRLFQSLLFSRVGRTLDSDDGREVGGTQFLTLHSYNGL